MTRRGAAILAVGFIAATAVGALIGHAVAVIAAGVDAAHRIAGDR